MFETSTSVIPDLIQAYGLWFVFFVVLLESSGIPLPGETALVTAAIYAGSTHQFSITAVVLVAAAAAILGDNIGYVVGRFVGLGLIVRHGRYVGLDEGRLKVGQYLFRRHGGKIVFFGRFVAFLRVFAAILAGINRMKWPHFLLMNTLGGICWSVLFGGGAYLFGEQIRRVEGPASAALLVAGVVAAIGGIIFFRHHEKELMRRAEASASERDG